MASDLVRSTVYKGEDPTGTPVDGFYQPDDTPDGGGKRPFKQGVILLDWAGRPIDKKAYTAPKSAAVTLTNAAVATIAAPDDDRAGLVWIVVAGNAANIRWSFNNFTGGSPTALEELQAQGMPWWNALPWREAGEGVGHYRGGVYGCVAAGQADVIIFRQAR